LGVVILLGVMPTIHLFFVRLLWGVVIDPVVVHVIFPGFALASKVDAHCCSHSEERRVILIAIEVVLEPVKGTAQVAVEISFKGFWAVSLALKVVSSDLRRAQGSRRSYGYEKAV
jgi:hypothetical protein